MASTEEIIQRLHESKPPATDGFTYLTIIEKSLSPDILPTLQELLEDAELTNDIGWDLVEMLLPMPGSEECLERIARLGNPREVLLKVLEVMEKTCADESEGEGEQGDDGADEEEAANSQGAVKQKRFITLCGMLSVLHSRLQVKTPSRFLHSTLQTVYGAYDATSPSETAAVIDLTRSLSGKKRPLLPKRQSSTLLETPFQGSNLAKNAPDPEAEAGGPDGGNDAARVERLLQSFVTCIVEAYVNSNALEWAARLIEYERPERIVSGRGTVMAAFKEVPELQARDALVGQLAALAGDVGLSKIPSAKVKQMLEDPISLNPLATDFHDSEEIRLSTTGFMCLVAYWVFASEVFDADHIQPDLHVFPDHYRLLKRVLGEEPQMVINANPGTTEALMVLAVWLDARQLIGEAASAKDRGDDGTFMQYHHLLTLMSVFHPNIKVRNAATVVAGSILHANPDEDDRLNILEDLLENCMFSTLQACAVTWLREEMASALKSKDAGSKSHFASAECLEAIQYTLFPDLTHLLDSDTEAQAEFWNQNRPFHLQAANFGVLLFGGQDYKPLVPAGMPAAVEHRYAQPLMHLVKSLKEAGLESSKLDSNAFWELDVMQDALERMPLQ